MRRFISYGVTSIPCIVREGWGGGACLGIRVIREASLSEQCFLAYKWPLMVTAELCSMSIVAGDMCAHSQLLAHP